MFGRSVFASLLAGVALAWPAIASAQQWPPPPPPAKNMDRLPPARTQLPPPPPPQRQVEEIKPAPIERAQEIEPVPRPREAPPKKPENKAATKHEPKHAAHTHAIACEGTFAKTSSQLRLENTYKSENVAFTQVDGSDGTKVMATVLFPNDPKQRLEVWWADEEKHSNIYLIVINGRSVWTVPRGVKLGLTLAALEKINRKPFKLRALDSDNGSQVSDWNGGALARLAGGCKVGVRLRAGSDTAAQQREAATGSQEFNSNDASLRARNPTVAEIILGY